ncbi:hypothetical protein SAMN04487983_100943 [Streptomyces sp. yr375]|uniref:hypothetical protein n=1 Tax=Streptomyces sp. yr375 TaxID=1761906 RepID=UPI0008D794E9|nr:hypothetical protein [Streptomyces sp. yr375]SEQ89675.1 hypothetical protein SAMN04487983_100943 [Streptomyces sp. yr375]
MLLADGTVPRPVYFDTGSGAGGPSVSEQSVQDGRFTHVPRAALLPAVCSCGWTGTKHRLDWAEIGEQELAEAGMDTADSCVRDWDTHTTEVERSAAPLPETFTAPLTQLESEIEKLAKSSPLAPVPAARRLEVTAAEAGYWPAHNAGRNTPLTQAAALGLNEEAARKLLSRFGRWSPYR